MNRFQSYILLLGAILLPGCTLYQKPEVPPLSHPEAFKVSLDNTHEFINDHWWENFNNLQLNALIEQAIANNYSYQIALKNIDIAQTYVSNNMTLLFPQLNADLENTRNKKIITVGTAVSAAPDVAGDANIFNLQTLTATVSYELDVWNQVHNSVNQAKANKLSVEANTNVVRLTLISAVANTYFQIMGLTQDIDAIKAQYKDAAEILELTQVQQKSGLVDESTVYLASTQAESILSTLKTTQKQKQILEYTLAYLIGVYPEDFSLEPDGNLGNIKFSTLIPEGIPSAVVGARPDIQSAYGQILSYGYLEKQNIANFLPNFTLTGTYGYASAALSQLIKSSNALWSYGLSTLQTLFNYPNLISQYKLSKLQYESAILSYQDAVLNAFVEIDGALISYKEDDQIMQSYSKQYENAKELLSIASAQYKAGLTDYIAYLTHDLNLLQSSNNLTHQQVIVARDIIQVYKTLGLGTQPDELSD